MVVVYWVARGAGIDLRVCQYQNLPFRINNLKQDKLKIISKRPNFRTQKEVAGKIRNIYTNREITNEQKCIFTATLD